MSVIRFVEGQKPQSQWRMIGKGWAHKSIQGAISGRIGMKRKDSEGKLQDIFTEITVKPDDAVLIRPNTQKRPNSKDPDYVILLLNKETQA